MSNPTSTDTAAQIIFGADVIMTTQGREITLHTPGPRGRQVIGHYTKAAEAWAALDELDAPLGQLADVG